MKTKAMIVVLMLLLVAPSVFGLIWYTEPYWLPVGTQNPLTINFGQSATAKSGSIGSIEYTGTIRVELRKTSGELVKILVPTKQVSFKDYPHVEVVTVSQSDYQNPGSYYLRFIAADSKETEQKQLTLIVKEQNVPTNNNPTITCPSSKTVSENQLLTFSVSGSDPDAGDTISFSVSNLPTGASFSSGSKQFSWTPDYDQAGSYSVKFTVSDNHGASASCTTAITVVDVNRCPSLDYITGKTVMVGNTLTITVSGSDPDGDGLTFSASGTPLQSGAVFDPNTRTFTWAPGSGDVGDYTVDFSVSDGKCAPVTQTIIIDVTSKNVPTASLVAVPSDGPEGTTVTFSCTASGGDAPLGYELDFGDGSAKVIQQVATHRYNYSGFYTASCKVTDADSDSATATAAVNITDNKPVVNLVATPSAGNAPLEVEFDCKVTGGNAPFTYLVDFGDGSSATTSKVKHTYTGTGLYIASCTVMDVDADLGYDNVAVNVSENTCPVLAPVGDKTVYVGNNLNFTLSATDAEGDSLNFTADMPLTPYLTSDGKFSWTPVALQVGKHTAVFRVSDGICEDSETITINVTAAPVKPQCDDGIDNDGDGKIDMQDPGCSSPLDNDENDTVTNHAPVADFNWTPQMPEVGDTVSFTSTSTDADNDTLTCVWDFNADGKADASGCTAVHVFTQPGQHPVTLNVSDGSLSDIVMKMINVTGQLNVTSINCFDPVVEKHFQSCSVSVEGSNGLTVAGASVKLYYLNGTLLDNCLTDTITGNCAVTFPSGSPGTYTVYATAEKSGWKPDLDKSPTDEFEVFTTKYQITNLAIYNDSAFLTEDYDFFRYEYMYIRFMVTDITTGQPTNNVVTSVALQSPPGGVAWFTKFPWSNPSVGEYHYVLRIPKTHDFLGLSQVYTFAFNFTDKTGGQHRTQVTIRNNPPVIDNNVMTQFQGAVFDNATSISLTPYESDVEDSGANLTWSVMGVDQSVVKVEIDANDTMTITPVSAGFDIVTLLLWDLDGDTDMIDVPIKTGSLVKFQCEDGIDNDKDGLVDMFDPGCSSPSDDNETDVVVLTQCSDGVDNDGDLLVDMQDPGCSSPSDDNETDVVVLTQCSDLVDNDKDGLIDMADPGCSSPSDDNETDVVVLTQCSDGVDNDGDLLVDMQDPGCSSPSDNDELDSVVLPQCADGIDNDGDLLIDLSDPGCANSTDNNESDDPVVLTQCSDLVDNDGDGKIDMADPGCSNPQDNNETDPTVAPQCSDGIDNDGDGKVDMQDPGCSGPGDNDETDPLPVTQCNDGIDNDGDGLIDMSDPGCSSLSDNDETNPLGNLPPVADIQLSRTYGAPGIVVKVNGSKSYDSDGTIASHSWLVTGPGNYTYTSSNSGNAGYFSIQLNSVGVYTFRLTVTDDDSASDTETKTVAVSTSLAQCDDGLDNDGDGKIDLADPHCADKNDNLEGEIFVPGPYRPFRDQDDLLVNRIDVNGFDVEGYAVSPGEYLQLSFGLQNNLGVDLKDIKVDASIQELGVRDSDLLRKLSPGDTATVVFNLDIPEYAEPGLYDIRFVVSNNDVRRVKYRTIVIA